MQFNVQPINQLRNKANPYPGKGCKKGINAVKEDNRKHVFTGKAAKSFIFSEALVKGFDLCWT